MGSGQLAVEENSWQSAVGREDEGKRVLRERVGRLVGAGAEIHNDELLADLVNCGHNAASKPNKLSSKTPNPFFLSTQHLK